MFFVAVHNGVKHTGNNRNNKERQENNKLIIGILCLDDKTECREKCGER